MLFFNILKNKNIINNYRRALIAIERLIGVFLPVVQDENVFKFTKEREKEMLRGVSRIFSSGADFKGWGGQKYFHYWQNRAQRGADNFLPPPPVNKFCPLGKTEGGGGQKIFFITLPLCPPGELFSSGAET